MAIAKSLPIRSANSKITTKLIFGTTVSILGLHSISNSCKIYNDSAFATTRSKLESNVKSIERDVSEVTTGSRYGLNYNELTLGSITGLFLGVIAGKLSTAIIFLAVSGYLLTQFLESRGIINIPWTRVIQIGSEKVDIKSLVLEKPNFKIPFVLTFLIAAYNI